MRQGRPGAARGLVFALLDSRGTTGKEPKTYVNFPDPALDEPAAGMAGGPTDPPLGRPAPGHDPIHHWGTSSTPPGPKRKRRGPSSSPRPSASPSSWPPPGSLPTAAPSTRARPHPPTAPSPGPADPPVDDLGERSDFPEQEPEPTPETVEVPTLTGMPPGRGQADPGRPWPRGDDQVQVQRPISCRDCDLAVSQGRSRGTSRYHRHPGRRQDAATATLNRAAAADHPSTELRFVLSRRVP
jgi:hypothetical protein